VAATSFCRAVQGRQPWRHLFDDGAAVRFLGFHDPSDSAQPKLGA